jgi:1-deoxy-D-xylulose-5-phosphate reductoisomerase
VVVLGSTGSIGRNSLLIAEKFGLNVEVLVAGKQIELLNKQIEKYRPKIVVIADENDRDRVLHNRVYFGGKGIIEALQESKSEIVVNALVGFSGLQPTLTALKLGKKLALANKESLVIAGKFLDKSRIQPIDSEHFGLWYLLSDRKVSKMTITASGGAFRDWDIEKIASAKREDALKHPNWSMGNKITVDSASMVNKLFELLEAVWLFGVKDIDAFIEPKSIVHSVVDFIDGSSTVHIAGTDMKLPIAFALLGEVNEEILKPINLLEVGNLEFREIDRNRYPLWILKDELLEKPEKGLFLNSANDFAVNRFLKGVGTFGDISEIVLSVFEAFGDREIDSLESVFEIHREISNWLESRYS